MADKKAKGRAPFIIVQLVILLAFGGYLGYQLKERQSADPAVRLQAAHEALLSGDDGTALKLFTGLAEAGNAQAQYWLGDLYENGLGTERDVAKGLSWMEKAAGQGLLVAEARLGEIYLAGRETVQDFKAARKWLEMAAHKGSAKAQRLLGQMEEKGLGAQQNLAGAYAWFELATLGGDGLAERLRDDLLSRMPAAAVEEGQTLAKKLSAEIAAAAKAAPQAEADSKTDKPASEDKKADE